MRRKAKVDDNQPDVVEALERFGASVQSLHTVGRGCLDLLVGYAGRNYLFEVKDGRKVPSKSALNELQEKWIRKWNGSAFVVRSPEEAVDSLISAALAEASLRRRVEFAEKCLKHYFYPKNWKLIGSRLRKYMAGFGKQNGPAVAGEYFKKYPNGIKINNGRKRR